jgi:mono/diheme cytochrome c family protein
MDDKRMNSSKHYSAYSLVLHLFVSLTAYLYSASMTLGADEDTNRGKALFGDYIVKTFQKHCFECHSHASGKAKGGLVLDSREGWAKGGDSGPAIVPGDPASSLLFQAINYSDGLEMPPNKRLSGLEIERMREWIALGAPDPRESAMAAEVAKAASKARIYGQ